MEDPDNDHEYQINRTNCSCNREIDTTKIAVCLVSICSITVVFEISQRYK